MFINPRRRSLLQLPADSLTLAALPAFAQTKTTRLMTEQLGRELGQQVVVENKTGANAGIAADFVAKAAPDGQTLFLTTTGAVAISPSLYEKLAYDPVRDLTPVTLVCNTDEVLVTSINNPANNVPEFIAAARAKAGGATMGSSGIGSMPHLAMELLADVTKSPLRHVPYKGVGPAIIDAMTGHIDGLFIDVPPALANIKGGKLKALGLAARTPPHCRSWRPACRSPRWPVRSPAPTLISVLTSCLPVASLIARCSSRR